MGRTKLEVNTSVFGQRIKLIYVTVGSRTTCASVVQKALEKCGLDDTPLRYQLCVISRVSGFQRLLKDDERPAEVRESTEANSYFQVRLRQSGILRVHYRTNGDYQTFYSVIVTPSMTTSDVVQVAAARFAPNESPDSFELVKRSHGGVAETLAASDSPFLCQGSCQLELRHVETKSKAAVNASHSSQEGPASDWQQSPKSRTMQAQGPAPFSQEVGPILEQHSISQGQRSKLSQGTLLPTHSQSSPGSQSHSPRSECGGSTATSDSSWETSLGERDHGAVTPRADSSPSKSRQSVSPYAHSSRLNHTLWVKLEEERVRVIQLEEQLSRWKDKVEQLEVELAASCSSAVSKENEVQSLQQEVGTLKNSCGTVLVSKPPLVGGDLTQVVPREGTAEGEVEQRAPNAFNLTSTSPPAVVPSLYDCLQGKTVLAVCVHRPNTSHDSGLEFDCPPLSGAVVKVVHEGSYARSVLSPGDIVLEINGVLCLGYPQNRVAEVLSKATDSIRFVIARDGGSPLFSSNLYHSTPLKKSEDNALLERKSMDESNVQAAESLGSELCEAHERCGLLQEELQAVNSQLMDSMMDYELVTSNHCALLNEVSYHAEEMEEVKSLVAEVKVALIGMQDVIRQEEGRLGCLERQNGLLSSELQALKEAQHVLEAQKEALESQVDLHTKKVEELRAELTLVKAENDQLILDLARRDREHTDVRRRVEAAEKERELKLATQLEENEKLTLKLRQQEDAASETKAVNCELQREKEILTAKLRTLQASLLSTEDNVRLLAKEKSTLQAERQFLEKELNSCKVQLESEMVANENLTAELETSRSMEASQAMTASRLQEETRQLRETRDALLAENARLKDACDVVEMQARANSTSAAELKHQLEVFEQEKGTLLAQLADVARASEDHLRELEETKTCLLVLQNESRLRDGRSMTQVASAGGDGLNEGEVSQIENKSLLLQPLDSQTPAAPEKEGSRPVESSSQAMDQGAAVASAVQLCLGSAEGTPGHKDIGSGHVEVGLGHGEEVALLQAQLRDLHRTEALQKEAREAERLVADRELEGVQSEAQRLRAELEEKQVQVRDSAVKLEETQSEAQRLRVELHDLKVELDSDRAALGKIEAELQHTMAAKEQAESQVAEVRVRLERQCEEARQHAASMDDQREQCSLALHSLEAEKERSAKLVSALKQLQVERDGLVAYERLYQQGQSDQMLLHKDLMRRERELQALRDKLVAVESELGTENHALRAQCMAKDEKMLLLNQRLREAESLNNAEVLQLKENVRQLQQEVKTLQDDRKAWEDASALNQANLRQLEAVLAITKEGKESALRDQEETKLTNERLQGVIAVLQEELAEVQSANDKLSIVAEERDTSTKEVVELTAKLGDLELALAASLERRMLGTVDAQTTTVGGLHEECVACGASEGGTADHRTTGDEVAPTRDESASHRLQTELEEARREKERALRDLEGARQKCVDLEEEVSLLKKVTLQLDKVEVVDSRSHGNRRRSAGQAAETQAKIETSQANMEVLRRLLETNEKKLRQSVREVEGLSAEKAALEMNLDVAKRSLEDKEKGMEELEKELCRLATMLAGCKECVKESQQRLTKEEQSRKETQKLLDDVMDAQRALQTSIFTQEDQKKKEILSLKDRIVELEREYGQARALITPREDEVKVEPSHARFGKDGSEAPCEAGQSQEATSHQDHNGGVDNTQVAAVAS
eukprot:Em0009g977a